jgi:hypothetical protein
MKDNYKPKALQYSISFAFFLLVRMVIHEVADAAEMDRLTRQLEQLAHLQGKLIGLSEEEVNKMVESSVNICLDKLKISALKNGSGGQAGLPGNGRLDSSPGGHSGSTYTAYPQAVSVSLACIGQDGADTRIRGS